MPPRGHAPCGFILFDRPRHGPSIARRPPSAQAQASGAIVTPGGKAESEINKALDKAPDGPARFARLMKGDDPKTVMTPPTAGGTKDGKTDQDKAAGAPGVKAEGKTAERTPPISTRREAQPGSQPEGNAATSNPSKAGEGPPDAGQVRRQRLQDLTSGIADLEDRMKRAETRREESALIRAASRLHAERERLGAAQESRVPEASVPDAPGLSARQADEDAEPSADDKESGVGEPLLTNAAEQPGALLSEQSSSGEPDAAQDFETAFSKIAARLRAATPDDRAEDAGEASPQLSPQFVSSASESRPGIVDDRFYDTVEHTYRAYVDFAKEQGMELTAGHLERYLEGTGEPITYDRETARSVVAVAEGEALNRKRFEEDVADPDSKLRKFLRRPEPGDSDEFKDHYDFEFGAMPIGLMWKDLSPLERALLFSGARPLVIADSAKKGRSHVLSGDLDAGFGVGSGEVKSSIVLTETREGNRILLRGEITHQWRDTYDFAPGGDFAAGALALEEAGRAKPFDFGATWEQEVVMMIEEENGEYTLKKVIWNDHAEGSGDG